MDYGRTRLVLASAVLFCAGAALLVAASALQRDAQRFHLGAGLLLWAAGFLQILRRWPLACGRWTRGTGP